MHDRRFEGFQYLGAVRGAVMWIHCPCRDMNCVMHVWWDGADRYVHQHGDNPEALLFVDSQDLPRGRSGVQDDPNDLHNPVTAWSYAIHDWLAA